MRTETLFGRTKRILLNNKGYVILAIAALVAVTASQLLKSVQDIRASLTPSKPKLTMLVTVKEGADCDASLVEFGDIQQASTLDIGFNNNSERNLMLTSVSLVPEWVTGSFFAGELTPSAQYDVSLADWLEMAQTTQLLYSMSAHLERDRDDKYLKKSVADLSAQFRSWCRPHYGSLCDTGVEGLIAAGKIRQEKRSTGGIDIETWWVKPEPIEIKDIPGNKFTISKGAAERILVHLGLQRGIDYLIGTVRVVAKTDGGDTVRSDPVKITVCTR